MSVATKREKLACGLVLDRFAQHLANLYGSILSKDSVLRTYESDPGFMAVANEALALDLSSAENSQDFTISDLAKRVRNAYALPMNLEMSPWQHITDLHRVAWEHVARCAAFMTQTTDADEASSAAAEFHNLAMSKLGGANV